MTYTDFIKETLQKASKIAIEKFGNVTGTTKEGDNNQVLTETDIEIGNLIIAEIKKVYPDYNIIDEEAGVIDNKSEFTWVVDPIDGTSNFASGVPTYGIMIGLLQNATPIAGGIALPNFNEIVVAEKGKGAFCNDSKLYVSSEEKLSQTLFAYQIDGHPELPEITKNETEILEKILLQIRNLRVSNSCFDAVQVAKGNYGGMVNQTTKIWDNIALHAVIEEAGGVYTDFFGKPMDYTNPLIKAKDNFTYCVASPVLHKQIQSIIHTSNQG